MNLKERYQQLADTILAEHTAAFAAQNLDEVRALMDMVKAADRIFVMGVGREGISTRAFAMRLMHLGKEVHWIWDDTTPGMGKGDLFLATNGSGQIGHIHYVVEQAKKTGASIAVVTGDPRQKTPALADCVLFVPAAVFNGTDPRAVPSVQPMGNLFEQHIFLLFDMIIMMLEEKLQLDHAAMEARHRNIE